MEELEENDLNVSNSFKQWIWNKYALIIVLFLVWMFFFDMNSFLVHHKLNKEINEIEHKISHFSEKLKQDSVQYYTLKNSKNAREKYARENYFMKKKNEDIFIVVHQSDSINLKN